MPPMALPITIPETFLSTHSNLTNSFALDLLGQAEYYAKGLIRSSKQTKLPPENTSCGICLEDLNVKLHVTSQQLEDDTVIHLVPCEHFFHNACVLRWFNSTRPERSTCPTCRQILFIADRLTAEQIATMDDDRLGVMPRRLPWGPHPAPGPDEEVVDWTTYMMHTNVLQSIDLEIKLARVERRRLRLVTVAQRAIRNLLAEAEVPLRPMFQEHQDGFMRVFCASHLLLWIAAYCPHHLRTREFQQYHEWVRAGNIAMNGYGPVLFGLQESEDIFDANAIRAVTVTRDYRLRIDAAIQRVIETGPEVTIHGPVWRRRVRSVLRRLIPRQIWRRLSRTDGPTQRYRVQMDWEAFDSSV